MYDHVKVVYVLINLLNVIVMVYFGVQMSRTVSKRKYWQYAAFPIISYCICMGLRFGRMIDYNLYADRYHELGKSLKEGGYELLFGLTNSVMFNLGLPYQCFILLGSFLLIYSFVFLLKSYRRAAPYMFVIFLIESYNAENYIRWYLGIAFFLFFIAFLHKSNYLKSAVFGIVAVLFHVGTLPLIAACLALCWVRRNMVPPVVAQVLLVVSVYLGSIQMLGFLEPYINFFGFDQRSASYADNFGQLINGQLGSIGVREELRWSTQIRKIVAYSFPLYIIPRLLKKNRIRYLDANLFTIGIIIAPIFGQVEILDRYGSAFLLFSVIVSGYSYYYVLSNYRRSSIYMQFFCVISLIFYVYPVFSDMFSRTEWYHMLFIWDADGREKLPLYYFLK